MSRSGKTRNRSTVRRGGMWVIVELRPDAHPTPTWWVSGSVNSASGVGSHRSELARPMGISQARISQLEQGEPRQFEVDTIYRYASALGGDLHIEVALKDERLPLTGTVAEPDQLRT